MSQALGLATPEVAANRVAGLRSLLVGKQLDYYLASNTPDIHWLTAWSGVFDQERAHLLLVAAQPARLRRCNLVDEAGVLGASGAVGKAASTTATATAAATAAPLASGAANVAKGGLLGYLKTDTRYSGAMRVQATAANWQIDDRRIAQSTFVAQCLKENNEDKAPVRIGIEANISLDRYRALEKAIAEVSLQAELVELTDTVVKLRARKDAGEIVALRAAQAITDAAFSEILNFIRPGLSERRVASELEYLMRNLGADGLAFPSIVASGPNSAVPHAIPGERQLQKGDFVLLDFGACKQGYCSDMTRTIVLGQASLQQQRIYSTVLRAQDQAKAQIQSGVAANEPALSVNQIFSQAGFAELSHGLGHGVGLEVHEQPVLTPQSSALLEQGNVLTVEPGIYIEGVGGVRIEDFGLVSNAGFLCFTTSTHELIEL